MAKQYIPEQKMDENYRGSPAYDATAEANRKILTNALEAMHMGDDDSYWSIFDPDVTFHEASCLPYGGTHVGFEAAQKAYLHLCTHFSKLTGDIEAVLASRDLVIIYQTITFEAAESGATGTLPVAEVYRFRNGKVIEWRANYFDALISDHIH